MPSITAWHSGAPAGPARTMPHAAICTGRERSRTSGAAAPLAIAFSASGAGCPVRATSAV